MVGPKDCRADSAFSLRPARRRPIMKMASSRRSRSRAVINPLSLYQKDLFHSLLSLVIL
jgi:hypothetical protein